MTRLQRGSELDREPDPLAGRRPLRRLVQLRRRHRQHASPHLRGEDGRATLDAVLARIREVAQLPLPVRLYKEMGVKQTFFFPGYCIDTYPQLVEAVLEAGPEVGLHGLHEVMNEQDAATELDILERGLEAAAS